MNIKIHRNETSTPIVYDALDAYTKGPLFCVRFRKNGTDVVHEYPLNSIFRIEEEYSSSTNTPQTLNEHKST